MASWRIYKGVRQQALRERQEKEVLHDALKRKQLERKRSVSRALGEHACWTVGRTNATVSGKDGRTNDPKLVEPKAKSISWQRLVPVAQGKNGAMVS